MEDDVRRLHVLQVQPFFDFKQRDEHPPSSLAGFQHVLDTLQLSGFPNPAMPRKHAANGYLGPGDAPRQQLLDVVRRQQLVLLPIHVQVRLLHLQGPSRIELAVESPQNIHRFDCSPCGETVVGQFGIGGRPILAAAAF